MEYFKLNDRVIVIGKNTTGKIAFIGETRFAEGIMYGVILDEPKGKYSGTVGDVCYFKCPKNHGTFVRACQLEKDSSNYSLEDGCVRPAYPNYLKDSSSKHSLKTQEVALKSEMSNHTTKKKPSNASNLHLSRSKQRLDEKYQKGDTITHHIGKQNLDFNEYFPQRRLESLDEALAELSIAKRKLAEQYKQMEAVHSYLRMLKTYLKWNEEYDKTHNIGDRRIDTFLQQLMDNVIKKLEEILNQKPNDNPKDPLKDDSTILSEENNFLRLCVGVSEKRNEVLTESLTHVRDILERAWSRSRSISKCECNNSRRAKSRCKNCASKQLFTDVIEDETRLFLKSNPITEAKPAENSNRMLEGFKGSGRIRKYLQTLIPDKEALNHVVIESQSSKMYDGNLQKKNQLKTSTSDNTVNKDVWNPLAEKDISLKRKDIPSSNDAPIRSKMRPVPVTPPRKCPSELLQQKSPFINLKDPSKGLSEFISGILSNANEATKSLKNHPIVNSPPPTSPKKSLQEQKTSMTKKSKTIADDSARSTSAKAERSSIFSSKCASERKIKWSKSDISGEVDKRNRLFR